MGRSFSKRPATLDADWAECEFTLAKQAARVYRQDGQQAARRQATELARRGLRIGRTKVGKGVFATKRWVDGTCLGEIEGRVIKDDLYVSRYAFDLDDGTQLEPAYPFRFVNHSCEPNCAFQSFAFTSPQTANPQAKPTAGLRKILIFAICDIPIGHELTIDYNWPACFAIRCNCRSVGCRGWIVDVNELPLLCP